MRCLVLLVSLLMLFPGLAQAQSPVSSTTSSSERAPSADASIDELVKIIENDETRAALIERLKQDSATSASETPAAAPTELSIVRQVAEYTRSAAEGVSATLRSLGKVFTDLQSAISGTRDADFSAFMSVASGVLMVAVGLFGSFIVLRILVGWLQRGLAERAKGRGWIMRISSGLGAALIDLAAVVIAWGIGYVVALMLVGDTVGQMGINQSLLLNAFLLVEITKLVVRLLLSPRFGSLRPVPVTDDNAAYWSFWIERIISLLGYSFLFVAPMLAGTLAPGLAAAVQVLAMATVVTIAIIVVLQNRDDVRNWLMAMAERRSQDGYAQVLVLLAKHWHRIAILYLLALLVVWFTKPNTALPFMLAATAQSLVAIVVGTIVVSFIARFVSTGLSLPSDIKERLPLLEKRLHAFVPTVMQVVRWLVIAGVVVAIAQAWALFDFVGWISADEGQAVAGSVISAALIILICLVLHVAVSSWIEYRLNPNFGRAPTSREKTLLGLFKNAFTIALVVFGMMLALAQIGVNIAPLLAGAGVIGLAIGFGAQKLVQDIITGIFIQFENAMNVGDVVSVGGTTGTVERLTIRSVSLRDVAGAFHIIPFSSVDMVTNFMRDFGYFVCDMGVAYRENVAEVKQAMLDAFEELRADPDQASAILGDLEWFGVNSFGDSSVNLRARIKCVPGKQWGVGRAFNEVLKRVFDDRDIEIPFPYRTLVLGEAKDGTTQKLRLASEGSEATE